jgi:hypothetical protein
MKAWGRVNVTAQILKNNVVENDAILATFVSRSGNKVHFTFNFGQAAFFLQWEDMRSTSGNAEIEKASVAPTSCLILGRQGWLRRFDLDQTRAVLRLCGIVRINLSYFGVGRASFLMAASSRAHSLNGRAGVPPIRAPAATSSLTWAMPAICAPEPTLT